MLVLDSVLEPVGPVVVLLRFLFSLESLTKDVREAIIAKTSEIASVTEATTAGSFSPSGQRDAQHRES